MAKNKMKEKVIDTEPIKDDREEVAEAELRRLFRTVKLR